MSGLPELVRRSVEEEIERGRADGAFDRLAGRGRPLESDADARFVPGELRMAFTILKNAGVAPEWVQLAGEVEAGIAVVRARLAAHREHVAVARRSLARVDPSEFAHQLRAITESHRTACRDFGERLDRLQRGIDRLDFIAPEAARRSSFSTARAKAEFGACWRWRPRDWDGRRP